MVGCVLSLPGAVAISISQYLLLRHTSDLSPGWGWGQDFPASYINQRRYRLADKPLGSCYTAPQHSPEILPVSTRGALTAGLPGLDTLSQHSFVRKNHYHQ